MVEASREERVGHFVETYYRSTAEVFEFSYGRERSERYAEQHMVEGLQALTKLGLKVRLDKERVSELLDVVRKIESIGARPELEETIAQLEGVGFLSKQDIVKYTKFLFMTDKEFREWLSMNEKFRALLVATVSKTGQACSLKKVSRRKVN